jgi:NADH:ubiquinone oxidoreductase subunit D
MNLMEVAAKLTEKILNIQGSNKAIEIQRLIFNELMRVINHVTDEFIKKVEQDD